MRKFVAILLMCLFTANICGAEVAHHLCGKVFQYISLNGHKKDAKCCCKGGKVDKGCCKTTFYKVKIDQEKNLAKAFSPAKIIFTDALVSNGPSIHSTTVCLPQSVVTDTYIPQKVRWWQEDIYIFHCVYRI
jgi:hypothetical protein